MAEGSTPSRLISPPDWARVYDDFANPVISPVITVFNMGQARRLKGSLFLFTERSLGKPRKNFVSLCLCGYLLFRVFCDNLEGRSPPQAMDPRLRENDGWLVLSIILPPAVTPSLLRMN